MGLNLHDQNKSHFHWLNHKDNYLFIIEGGQKLKTISIGYELGKELHSATLTENKTCTSFSWNKDAKVVALVVNKSQIYLWEVANNNFTHFKPSDKTPGRSSSSTTNRKNKIREIDSVLWSKVSNKLLVCYSSGQLSLACFETSLIERFIDNGDGVLDKISFVERSDHLDLFVCVSVLSEILVMTFDGDAKLYIQREDSGIMKVSFSPPSSTSLNQQVNRSKRPGDNNNGISISNSNRSSTSEASSSTMNANLSRYQANVSDDVSLWLSYKNSNNRILLKRIILNTTSTLLTSSQSDIVFNEASKDQHLIDFYWLDSSHLIVGFSSGLIQLIEVKYTINTQILEVQVELIYKEVLDIRQDVESWKIYNSDCHQSSLPSANRFIAYELKSRNHIEHSTSSYSNDRTKMQSSKQAFSLIAMTDYQVFYYEIIEYGQSNSKQYAFESIDDLNLTGSLQKIKLKLAHMQWSFDCSMLALQLSNGHILVYRTRLQDYLVVSCGAKAAYLSDTNEITILNYEYESDERKGAASDNDRDEHSFPIESSNYNALTLNVTLKPSVIAIGPKHLAIALNNRVRFYLTLAKKIGDKTDEDVSNLPFYEEEYVSIVVSLKLCSRFVAILFDDGRLKLEMIKSSYNNEKLALKTAPDNNTDSANLDERFFPDPTNPETVTSFVLTEDLFVYCTAECSINVFCFKDWLIKQTLNYSQESEQAILKVISNVRGNKFICILGVEQHRSGNDDNVFLYDLYTNKILRFVEGDLCKRLLDSQLIMDSTDVALIEDISKQQQRVPKLDRIIDAIWDKDGRTVLLIEQNYIHNYIVIDHTLEEGETCIEFVSTGKKASSHTTLYASHGIISFQTSLGRVINTISDSYDDELKLSALKQQIQGIVKELETGDDSEANILKAKARILNFKLEYLKLAMRVHSLTKCKEICEHLMSDEQFNIVPEGQLFKNHREIDLIIWKQLAARSLFTLNLNFALMIFRKHRMLVFARVLNEIIRDVYLGNLDSKASLKTRLMVLLGCYNRE